jgi:hypothetical protein
LTDRVDGWSFILSPSARTGPSRLDPAGEGRSDGGVLHPHPRGQARYPEGGRRREDEPPGEGWRVPANTGETSGTRGDEHLESDPRGGSRPPCPRVWFRSPRFFTPYRPTRTRQDLPYTSAGEPRTPGWRAINVPLAPVTRGCLTVIRGRPASQVSQHKGRNRTDSQADSTSLE